MAALTVTDVGLVRQIGDVVEKTIKVTTGGIAQATEWAVTGLSEIESVAGAVVLGTATTGLNFVLNANGTGDTEGNAPGNLGIESEAAATVQITVRGKH